MVLETIKKFESEDILEITLLSISEYKRCKSIIPKTHDYWWWLRSPGFNSNYAAFVNSVGDVYFSGCDVNDFHSAVRPAFRIKNLKSEIGEKVFIGNLLCTVIDGCCVLSDSIACYHRFDGKSNDFETSEIKEYINSDTFKLMIELIDE